MTYFSRDIHPHFLLNTRYQWQVVVLAEIYAFIMPPLNLHVHMYKVFVTQLYADINASICTVTKSFELRYVWHNLAKEKRN